MPDGSDFETPYLEDDDEDNFHAVLMQAREELASMQQQQQPPTAARSSPPTQPPGKFFFSFPPTSLTPSSCPFFCLYFLDLLSPPTSFRSSHPTATRSSPPTALRSSTPTATRSSHPTATRCFLPGCLAERGLQELFFGPENSNQLAAVGVLWARARVTPRQTSGSWHSRCCCCQARHPVSPSPPQSTPRKTKKMRKKKRMSCRCTPRTVQEGE